ncbi:Helix-turn-helix domain protein [Falsiruegeria litorea R37]|uniref:Helix-turn-helix domain protein n=1 Tax=Falsiruegeria litorea R37 TaxID=1200284 RepID=A0A1Y5RPV2_9RHOB|nr:helix-turn-helix domain-containing protein [Falsiruegeria litorea]SLN19833.1 Helix-turn-helix domain protein [Falsiruegeria litorea R37]
MSQTAPSLSAADVADHLNVSRRTVWRVVERGDLPEPIRLGRIVRWSLASLPAMGEPEIPPLDVAA